MSRNWPSLAISLKTSDNAPICLSKINCPRPSSSGSAVSCNRSAVISSEKLSRLSSAALEPDCFSSTGLMIEITPSTIVFLTLAWTAFSNDSLNDSKSSIFLLWAFRQSAWMASSWLCKSSVDTERIAALIPCWIVFGNEALYWPCLILSGEGVIALSLLMSFS